MGKPSAPPPPDPMQTSAAQTGTNIGTATANTMMGNVNQVTPYGSLGYEQTGTYTYTDPYTGQSYQVPQFTATTTLTPESQAIFDTTMGTQANMANLANSQSAALGTTLAQPIDASTLPGWGTMPTAPTLSTVGSGPQMQMVGKGPQLQTSYGPSDGYAENMDEVQAATMARMQPGLDAQATAMNASLANQGIALGSEAYSAAQFDQAQAQNDAEMAAVLAAGQEQSRLAGLDYQQATFGNTAEQQMYANQMASAGFNNSARQQMYTNDLTSTGFNNDVAQTGFGNDMTLFGAQNDLNNMALQQEMALRNQSINEMNALQTGAQVTVPQFGINQPAPIPTTDVAGNIYGSYNAEMNAYNQQMAQYNSMMGGLFGLGAAGITGMYGMPSPYYY